MITLFTPLFGYNLERLSLCLHYGLAVVDVYICFVENVGHNFSWSLVFSDSFPLVLPEPPSGNLVGHQSRDSPRAGPSSRNSRRSAPSNHSISRSRDSRLVGQSSRICVIVTVSSLHFV